MLQKDDLKYLFLSVIMLSMLGLVFISAATSYHIASHGGLINSYLLKQTIFLLIGMFLAQAISTLDIKNFEEFNKILFFFVLALLVATFVPGFGVKVNGSNRWINLIFFRLQPSELIKIFFILYLAYTIPVCQEKPKKIVGLILIPYIIMAITLLNQPDLGSTVIITLILGISAFLALKNFTIKLFSFLAILAGTLVTIMIITSKYRMARVTAFLDPMATPEIALKEGFQLSQSFKSIATGDFFSGLGWSNSVSSRSFLPENHTDFIFSTIPEQFGILFSIALVLLIFAIPLFLLRISQTFKNQQGRLFISVFSIIWLFEDSVNLFGVLGLAPQKGLALKLISYGGSNLISVYIGLGICLAYGYFEISNTLKINKCKKKIPL